MNAHALPKLSLRRIPFMVGNMIGTSMAMAPAFLLGQLCSVRDLDGPLFLKPDRPIGAEYGDGRIDCSEAVWGGAA